MFVEVWPEVVVTLTTLASYFVNPHNAIIMAFLEELQFTGSLGDLSFYRMQGSDKIVVRRKGGANKETIKKSPKFAVPRLYMSEFGGCSKMGKEVRHMLHPMKALADYNFSGFINKSLKLIQKQDATSALGRRAIELSKHPRLLEGFQLNKYTTFDAMVRSTLTWSIDVENGTANIAIPALIRDINFFPNNKHAKFSIMITLGVVPDFAFNPYTNKFEPPSWYTQRYGCSHASSAWYAAVKGSPATTLNVALPQMPPDARYSLMLTVGICFGAALDDGEVQQVKRAGAAKILGIVPGRDGVSNEGMEGEDNEPDHMDTIIENGEVKAPVLVEEPVAGPNPSGLPPVATRRQIETVHQTSRRPGSGDVVQQSFMYTYVMKDHQIQDRQTYTCHYTISNSTAERAMNSQNGSHVTVGYAANHWIR